MAHDKCGNLLVNAGESVCMLKSNISIELCCHKQQLKIINAIENFQIHRHGGHVCKIHVNYRQTDTIYMYYIYIFICMFMYMYNIYIYIYIYIYNNLICLFILKCQKI